LPVRDVATEIAALRLVKDADEVARLRRAIDITAEAQRRAMAMVKPGVWEYEIEAEIESTFRRRGAERVGFPSIVGSGPNSTTLHYDKNRRQTRAGELVVADIGAEWGYYTADVTRTMPVSGRFTDRQRALYDLVLATQQAGIDAVRAGATVGDLERAARAYMREHSGTLCGEVTCDRYFVHGLRHWLGMDVHDVGSYATPLAPGMVVTVEPGIYIAQENIGIRIEDDVLVTAGAPEVLSAAAPRRAADIEALMARH
jgi:Xaa-Pro aminopeptidase